jgi:hypothetical protein
MHSCGGFIDRNSHMARGIVWQEEMSPTIRSSIIPSVVIYEKHKDTDRKEVL